MTKTHTQAFHSIQYCAQEVGLDVLTRDSQSKLSMFVFVMSSLPTCGSLRPLESESEVSLYWEEAISTSVDALLRFFSGLQASDISLAPGYSKEAGFTT